jgi:hypothetical protein
MNLDTAAINYPHLPDLGVFWSFFSCLATKKNTHTKQNNSEHSKTENKKNNMNNNYNKENNKI